MRAFHGQKHHQRNGDNTDYHGWIGPSDPLFCFLPRLAERLGSMVDLDLVFVRPAFGNRRPPLPLAGLYRCPVGIRAMANTQVAAQYAGTFRLMLLYFPWVMAR